VELEPVEPAELELVELVELELVEPELLPLLELPLVEVVWPPPAPPPPTTVVAQPVISDTIAMGTATYLFTITSWPRERLRIARAPIKWRARCRPGPLRTGQPGGPGFALERPGWCIVGAWPR
jgi:hypothetical protein